MTWTPREEKELIERARHRESDATRALLGFLGPTLHYAALRFLPGWTLATGLEDRRQGLDELMQEILLELFAKNPPALAGYDPERGSLKAFARTVATRVCHRVVSRKPTLISAPLDEGELSSEASDLEDRAAHRALLGKMYALLVTQLTPTDLLLFDLCIVQEKDAQEVERLTGISANTVHVRKFRIRKRARAILERLEHEEPREGGEGMRP